MSMKASGPRRATRALAARALLFLLPWGTGCARTQLEATAPALQQATLSVGDRQYQFDTCNSGDLEYFLGVDLTDQRGGAFVRVLIDPIAGPRLRIVLRDTAATEAMVLERAQCRQLDADVKYTGWEVNTVRDFSGFVDAECRGDDGQAISLHVRFLHCH